ncbi:Uncharacterized conserved protein [Phaffia rhodozyma]|uniref:Conserved oligomeric Golgi complex subunit 7 n=1 Tax=Phaffia rhodozyma TaxID=264483 RepID=A0A0F7SV81_PHARH|nr:Uncharacterized conserved protein [Phaffia rhodozyma]
MTDLKQHGIGIEKGSQHRNGNSYAGSDGDRDEERDLDEERSLLGMDSSAKLVNSLDMYDGDVSAWLNDLLDEGEDDQIVSSVDGIDKINLEAIDEKVRTLLGRLSGISQDTSQQLEQTIHDISRTVPRLTYDLQFMRESAASLRVSLHGIESRTKAAHPTQSKSESVSISSIDGPTGFSSDATTTTTTTTTADDEETKGVLERLKYLDKVKQGMEATLAVLKEAESWSTLELEFTSLLAEGLFHKAAERLAEASKSVAVFTHNTAEYESRRSLLVSLQNQLEASLSAALVKALREKDEDGRKNLFEIFGMIQREGEFRGYYYASRRTDLVDRWEAAVLTDCESVTSQETGLGLGRPTGPPEDEGKSAVGFNPFLSGFYSSLLSLVAEERTVLPSIFPDPQPTLMAFIQNVFDSLNPSLGQRLELLVESHGPSALTELITAFKSTEDLALGIQSNMDKLTSPSQSSAANTHAHGRSTSPAPASLTRKKDLSPSPSPSRKQSVSFADGASRRYSRRLTAASVSYSPGVESPLDGLHPHSYPHPHPSHHHTHPQLPVPNAGGPWEIPLYEPFLDYQTEYGQLERRLVHSTLDKALDTLDGVTVGGAEQADAARVVGDRSVEVFALAEGALDRCLGLTHGFGAVELVKVVNELLARFLARCENLFSDRDSSAKQQQSNGSTRRENAMDELDEVDQLEMDGMNYSSEDWGTFQLALHLIGTCRGIQDRLFAFESKLQQALQHVATAFLAARDDPAGHFFSRTTKGSITLLQQSGLNSKDLHDLLESLGSTHGAAGAALYGSIQPSHLRAPSFFPSSHTFGAPSNAVSASPASNSTGSGVTVVTSGVQSTNATPSRNRRTSTWTKNQLMEPARKSLIRFTTASQLFLQKTILSPLHQLLSKYPSLPVYSFEVTSLSTAAMNSTSSSSITGASTKPKQKAAISTIGVPRFSTAPTDTVARIGEGLLNLPRLFEVYADDDALSFSLDTLPFIDPATLREFRAAQAQDTSSVFNFGPSSTHPENVPLVSPTHLSPLPSPSATFPPSSIPGKSSGSASSSTLPPEMVVSLHLSSLTLSLLSAFTSVAFDSLPPLGPNPSVQADKAAEQLGTDVGYLVNVVRALDVDWSEGQVIKDCLDLTEDQLRAKVRGEEGSAGGEGEREGGGKEQGGLERRKVMLKVAKLRGIS